MKNIIEMDPEGIDIRENLCIVRRLDEVNKSGIIMPEGYSRKKVKKYLFIKAGPKAPVELDGVGLGAEVVAHGHSKPEYSFMWRGEYYDIIQMEDILGVLEASNG